MYRTEPEGALMLVHSSCRADSKHTVIRTANAWDDVCVRARARVSPCVLKGSQLDGSRWLHELVKNVGVPQSGAIRLIILSCFFKTHKQWHTNKCNRAEQQEDWTWSDGVKTASFETEIRGGRAIETKTRPRPEVSSPVQPRPRPVVSKPRRQKQNHWDPDQAYQEQRQDREQEESWLNHFQLLENATSKTKISFRPKTSDHARMFSNSKPVSNTNSFWLAVVCSSLCFLWQVVRFYTFQL